MTAHLPPSLLALFAPRPPIPYIKPPEKVSYPELTGIADLVSQFQPPTPDEVSEGRNPFENKKQRKKRKIREKIKAHNATNEELAKNWDPTKDPKTTGDPYRTLFVTKMNFNTTEHKLKREFELYGPIKKVRIVNDNNGKPRGYGFIEYEKERDMRTACKEGDGKKIDGRRVLVDTERGRTMRGWHPRKFGGGLGHTRATSEEREIMREKERDRERDRDKDKERRERDPREYDRDRERGERERGERDRERDRGGDKDRERSDHRSKDKERSSRSDRDKERGSERSDRDREHRRESEGGESRKRPRSRERDQKPEHL